MKKAIIIGMCAAVMGTGFTSCLDVENERFVEVGDMNTNDSAFYFLSILNGVKALAPRLVLLGELRGDLMTTTSYAATNLREIDQWTLDQNTDNPYLTKTEYYNIINQCNYIIQYGAALPKEQAAATTMRAWAYLQLAINYGKAEYYENFIGSEEAAYDTYPEYGIDEMADLLIPQLEAILNVAPVDYGTYGTDFSMQIFNPRFVLADLYLWRGSNQSDYVRAAELYYDLIVNDYANAQNSGTPRYATIGLDFSGGSASGVINRIVYTNSRMNPMNWAGSWSRITSSTYSDTDETYSSLYEAMYDVRYSTSENGVICSLDTLCGLGASSTSLSTSDRLEEISLTATRAMSSIFSSTLYTYYDSEDDLATQNENTAFSNYLNRSTLMEDVSTRLGDLRINVTYTPSPGSTMGTSASSAYPDSVIAKYLFTSGNDNKTVTIFRNGYLYLRYAEAVNRAGKPGLAMIALKYGLNDFNVRFYMPTSEKLREDGEMTFALFMRSYANENTSVSYTSRVPENLYSNGNDGIAVGSFVYDATESRLKATLPESAISDYLCPDGAGFRVPISMVTEGETTKYYIGEQDGVDPSYVFYCFKDTTESYYDFPTSMYANVGLHWRGSGCAALDSTYRMPNERYPNSVALQQAYMDSIICNEYALETAHEGGRFYDLMRLSKHRSDPEFLLYYLSRKYDQTVIEKMRSSGHLNGEWDYSSWYLPDYEKSN